jgi:hypothetical protein
MQSFYRTAIRIHADMSIGINIFYLTSLGLTWFPTRELGHQTGNLDRWDACGDIGAEDP